MADNTEIITVYKAEIQGYLQEIDKIVSKVRTLAGEEKKQASDSQINARELISSGQQRKKLLEDEIANLKKLEATSKKAFTVPEIKDFNQRIAESKNNIALLKGETGTLNEVTGKIKEQFANLGAVILAAFSVNAIINFSKDSIKAFQEAELSAKKLETAIVNIGGEGEKAFQRLLDQSKKLQEISVFSDEDIQRAQTQLSQFGLLSNEIEDVIPKILDLASAQGIDLGQATDIVIQGINGVTRGLKPLGIEFKNTGDKAQNLAIISEKLNRFQGQTAAVLDTSAGRAKNLGNQFDELKERIGGLIESSGILKNFTSAFQTFIDSFKTQEEFAKETSDKLIQGRLKVLQAEGDALLNFAIKNNQAFENLSSPEKEKFIAGERIKILDKFKERVEKNNEELKKENDKLTDLAVTNFKPENKDEIASVKSLIDEINLENKAIEILIQTKKEASKTNLGLTEEEKTRRETEALQKKQKLLAEEKQIQEAINKLSVETEPDIQKKVAIQKEIDAKITETIKEDLRTREQIELDLNKKKNDLLILQNLKAFQDVAKLETARSFDEDEKNLTDFVNNKKNLLLSSNLTEIQLDRELTALNEFELQQRLQNAIDANTGIEKDSIESKKRIAKAQQDIDNFEIEQLKKAATERLKVQQEIQNELLRARRQQFKEGSIEDLELQKENATKLADADLQAQLDIIQNIDSSEKQKQDAIEKTFLISLKLNNDLTDLTEKQNAIRLQNFQEIFGEILDFVQNSISSIDTALKQSSENRIQDLEDEKDAQLAAIDAQTEALQNQKNKNLISEKQFEDQSAKLKERRIATENKINDAINIEKRKQAQIDKDIAIMNIILNTARGVMAALDSIPPNIPLSILIGATGAVELAVAAATPLPKFKKGTKRKPTSGLAEVGEQGSEIIYLPSGAKVLPNPKVRKYETFIDSMFDNELDKLIHKDYVVPAIIENEKKILKNEEIKKQQEINSLKKSVNEIVSDVVNKKTVSEEAIKKLNITEENKTTLINSIHSINKISNETEKTKAIKNFTSVSDNIVFAHQEKHLKTIEEKTRSIEHAENLIITRQKEFNDKIASFQKSLNYDYSFLNTEAMIIPALTKRKREIEKQKEKSFAENIANAFVLNNKTEMKSDAMSMSDYVYLHTNKLIRVKKAQMNYLAEKIAEKISEKLR